MAGNEDGIATEGSGHIGAVAVGTNRSQAAKSSSVWGLGCAGVIGGARRPDAFEVADNGTRLGEGGNNGDRSIDRSLRVCAPGMARSARDGAVNRKA